MRPPYLNNLCQDFHTREDLFTNDHIVFIFFTEESFMNGSSPTNNENYQLLSSPLTGGD